MKNRITIKDIAKELNIHHSTVSRALRNDMRVKEETRQQIITYADEHGYQINLSALQLRGSKRNVLAIIVPNINHSFFSNIVSSFTDLAKTEGYIVSVFQSNESFEQEKKIINTIIQNNVAGVAASVSMQTTSSEHFKKLKKYNIPLVLFDRIISDLNVSKVIVNNSEVIAKAVNLLVQKGCKRIAHIGGPQQVNVFSDRHNGFLKAIEENQLAYNKSIIISKGFSFVDGQNSIIELFKDKTKPDAIICDSSLLLTGALIELKKLNIQVPKQLKIVGFSDNPYIKAFTSGLIYINQPDQLVSENTFQVLMKHVTDKNNHTIENIIVSSSISEN